MVTSLLKSLYVLVLAITMVLAVDEPQTTDENQQKCAVNVVNQLTIIPRWKT